MSDDITINNTVIDDDDENEPIIPPLIPGVSKDLLDQFIKKSIQFHYGCDGASLATIVNGIEMRFFNDRGDGDGTVFITTESHFDLGIPFDHDLIADLEGQTVNGHTKKVEMWLKAEDTDQYGSWRLTAENIVVYRVPKRRDFVIRLLGRASIDQNPSYDKVQAMCNGQVYDADLF